MKARRPDFTRFARGSRSSSVAVVRDLGGHWGTVVFSLVIAMGIWVAIQDVDNPRVEGRAPASGGIEVTAVNIPDGFLVEPLQSVIVRVEARRDDLSSLRPADFRAQVDIGSLRPTAEANLVRVQVDSRRRGVQVIEVVPSTIEVRLVAAGRAEFSVEPRVVSPPPPGFRVRRVDDREAAPRVDPPFVTVTGRSDLVARVAAVELAVSLSSARTDNSAVEGDLVARSADGNVVDVQLSVKRARATYEIEEIFSARTVGIEARTSGRPAPGFVVGDIVLDPPVVEATGPKGVIDALRGPLILEEIDLTGARQSIIVTKTIERPPNVSLERQTVVVRIEIRAVEQSATFVVAVTPEGIPPGLSVEIGPISVQVRVSGALAIISALKPTDLKATVSLADAKLGVNTGLTPRVTAPPGVKIDGVDALTIVLKSVTVP